MSGDRLSPLFSWRGAIARSHLPATTKLVAHTLSLFMSAEGDSCFPSYSTIGARASVSRRSAIEHVRRLVEEGWLEKKPLSGPVERGGKSNRYSARVPEVVNVLHYPGEANDAEVVNDVHPTASGTTSRTASGAAAPRGAGPDVGKRNPTWDALAAIFGEPTTKTEKSLRGKRVEEIRLALELPRSASGSDAAVFETRALDEIRKRVSALRRHWRGDVDVTLDALVKHWTLATRLVETGRPDVRPPTVAPCSECGVGGGYHADDCPNARKET